MVFVFRTADRFNHWDQECPTQDIWITAFSWQSLESMCILPLMSDQLVFKTSLRGERSLREVPLYASATLIIIVSGNGLSPVWRQAIIWSNCYVLSIGPLGTSFNEIWIKTKVLFEENTIENSVCKTSTSSRPQCVNPSNSGIAYTYMIYKVDPNLAIIANDKAANGARPSAGTVLTGNLETFSLKFLCLSAIL